MLARGRGGKDRERQRKRERERGWSRVGLRAHDVNTQPCKPTRARNTNTHAHLDNSQRCRSLNSRSFSSSLACRGPLTLPWYGILQSLVMENRKDFGEP
jgi:hypothetical protein